MTDKKTLSPCKNICQTDNENQYCIGCYRTLQEISQWTKFSRAEKIAILKQLSKRRQTTNVFR